MHFIKVSFLIFSAAFLFPSAESAAAAEDSSHFLALVLGPARSGTSTIARAVNACGYSFTPTVVEQQEQSSKEREIARPRLNPKGTFEDGLFLKIGEQFLNRTQINTSPFASTHPLAKKGRANIGKFFNRIFSEDTHVVLKHPSLSAHASVLESRAQQEDVGAQHLNIQFLYVVALRNPVDTALSMLNAYQGRSPNISVEDMLREWQENLKTALQTTVEKRRFFIKYEDVMENTDETLSKLSTFLGTSLTSPALAAFKGEFLTDSLRHGRTPFTEVPPGYSLTADQVALRDELEALYGAQST